MPPTGDYLIKKEGKTDIVNLNIFVMSKKRFSRYKFALKANNGEAGAGSALGKYKDYSTGATKPTYTQSPDSNPVSLDEVWIIPFQAGSDDSLYHATVSKRSITGFSVTKLAIADLNHITPVAEPKINTPKFSAARAIIAVAGVATSKETSKITGIIYNKKTGLRSYSYPIGRKKAAVSDTNCFSSVASVIRGKSAPAGSSNSVSFKPEIFT